MRKNIKEGVDFGNVAEKVVSVIKGNGHNVIMFTGDGMETSDPQEARRFYVKKPNFMITVDAENAVLRINKNSNVGLEDVESILKQLRRLARQYMLNTEVREFGKEITPKDFSYQAKRWKGDEVEGISESQKQNAFYKDAKKVYRLAQDAFNRGDSETGHRLMNKHNKLMKKSKVSEASISRLHGTKKTSYQTLESVKLVIRHRTPVDEEKHGSRARQIKEIFIEQNGERTRFPHNYLPGARAMARHMYEGGEFDDNIGQYIVESVANLKKLKEFVRYSQRNNLINEDSEDIVKTVKENISAYRNEISKLTGPKTYHQMRERIEARDNVIEENETDDIRDMFTVRKFDENLSEALPLIKRLVMEKNAWRSRIEEASAQPFVVSSTEDLTEADVFEFDSPKQKTGYRIRGLAERATEESELSQFIYETAEKLIEGKDISKFESFVVRNVLENVKISDEDRNEKGKEKCPQCKGGVWTMAGGRETECPQCNGTGYLDTDALQEAVSSIDKKLKLVEYGLGWEKMDEDEQSNNVVRVSKNRDFHEINDWLQAESLPELDPDLGVPVPGAPHLLAFTFNDPEVASLVRDVVEPPRSSTADDYGFLSREKMDEEDDFPSEENVKYRLYADAGGPYSVGYGAGGGVWSPEDLYNNLQDAIDDSYETSADEVWIMKVVDGKETEMVFHDQEPDLDDEEDDEDDMEESLSEEPEEDRYRDPTGDPERYPFVLKDNPTVEMTDDGEYYVPLSDDGYWYLGGRGVGIRSKPGKPGRAAGSFDSKEEAEIALHKFLHDYYGKAYKVSEENEVPEYDLTTQSIGYGLEHDDFPATFRFTNERLAYSFYEDLLDDGINAEQRGKTVRVERPDSEVGPHMVELAASTYDGEKVDEGLKEESNQWREVPSSSKVGKYVKVLAGPHKGKNGQILRVYRMRADLGGWAYEYTVRFEDESHGQVSKGNVRFL